MRAIGSGVPIPTVTALNDSVTKMWSTFGGPTVDELSFSGTATALRSHPAHLKTIDAAAAAPRAIEASRQANASGVLDELAREQDFFAERLRCHRQDARVAFLMANRRKFFEEAPTESGDNQNDPSPRKPFVLLNAGAIFQRERFDRVRRAER